MVCTATTIASPAQTLTRLYSFCAERGCTDGSYPFAALVQATNGNLYGTTLEGGLDGFSGTVFTITPSGTLTTLHSLGSSHGSEPYAGVVQATDGNFYGTTTYGGGDACSAGCGTVFETTPTGALTTLYRFCSQSGCPDGAHPTGTLVQATNGNFYGTTCGSICSGPDSSGTVFEITPTGTLTTLYSFCSQNGCPDGESPSSGLIEATDGNFYGTTAYGGANGLDYGTVFKVTPSGTLTTLYTFCSRSGCPDGSYPYTLVQATDGYFYGTTQYGGTNNYGTVFKITSGGTLTTLYNFCSQSGCTDGEGPAALVQATDGNLYGTTEFGGVSSCELGCGTVFKMTAAGTLTTLYSFCSEGGCPDGQYPGGALAQDTSGNFYGTTFEGGANRRGTVFSLSVGLGPFVETQPTLGPVGRPVRILGSNLTGATSVTFNGTAAVFRVLSSSLINTIVPAGATTGTVRVVTPGGTLSSNVPFRVRP